MDAGREMETTSGSRHRLNWRWLPKGRWPRRFALAGLALVALLLLIQAVPYGRSHTNPPVTAEPAWDSPQTERLFTESCGDCHSNRTRWPWYTNIAPASWLAQSDVDEGRAELNLSRLGDTEVEMAEIEEVIREGEMPPWQYTLIHRGSALSSVEREQLISGLRASLARPPVTAAP